MPPTFSRDPVSFAVPSDPSDPNERLNLDCGPIHPPVLRDPRWPAQWDIQTRREVFRAAMHLRTALEAMVQVSSYATRDLSLAMTHTEDALTRLREYITTAHYHETTRERACDAETPTLDFLLPSIPKRPNPPDVKPSS